MAEVLEQLIDGVSSVILGTGVVDTVNAGDVMSLPGNGLHAAVYMGYFEAAGKESGLASVSLRVNLLVRIHGPVHAEPTDEIDPGLLRALAVIGKAYLAGFSLDGLVRAIDVFGSNGQRMTGQFGYLDVQEGTRRVLTITLPVVVDKVWEQVA